MCKAIRETVDSHLRLTSIPLSDEETEFYKLLPCGLHQTQDAIRMVIVNHDNNTKQILEYNSNGLDRIYVKL